jgi:hypothetical protein
MNEENFIVGGQCPHALRYADCSKCNKQQPTTDPTTEIDLAILTLELARLVSKLELDLNEARDKVDSLETQNRAIKGQLKYLEDDSIAELVQLQKVCDELAAALRKDTVASFAIANSKPDAATICKQADDMHVTALTNYSTLPHVKAKENKL